MITATEITEIGKFQKTHALKGELNMMSEIYPEYFTDGNPLIIDYDGIFVPYFIESVRPKGSTSYLVKLSGVDSEEEASQFVNKEIYILKKDAEEWLGEDYVDSETLIGFSIIDAEDMHELGVIEDIDDSTSNVLFITRLIGGGEAYIPANDDLIRELDEDEKKIVMEIPEGLLDLNKKE